MTAWRLTSLAACVILGSSAALPAHAGKADNSIRFAHEQVLNHADPYFSATYIAGILGENVWDTLVYRDPRSGAYQGGLAVAWRSIDDRTLELDLRQGVVFHDGSPFGADDVVYTLNFVSRPENNAFNLNLVRWIDHVEKTGPYQVRLVAKAAAPAALAFLASRFIVIHPHDYYARVGPSGVNKQPIGTGPFRVVEHALGRYMVLERNARYFSGGPKAQPQVQRVEIRFIPDAQTRVAEVVTGGLDLIVNVGRDQAEQLRHEPGLAITSAPTESYAYLQMNTLPRTWARAA
jgi:peptide/nickel transport system substrate-binding protein